MAAVQISPALHWVGVLDKDLRVFDIVMRTDNGTTYNAYILKGSDKTVLFDTVKDGFFDIFIANIREVCDPADIDYIVASHTEPDHSGTLARLLKLAPKATVLASQTALTFLEHIVQEPFPAKAVADNETLDIGGYTLQFLSAPMLHWPDTIFTYVPEAKALFSCDFFGCHYADDRIFNDLVGAENFFDAYKYYFDCIMAPFKYPFAYNAVQRVKALDVAFIGTGHGPVLRSDIPKYLGWYEEWSTPSVKGEKSVAIVYVSAYGYTRALAQAIHKGLLHSGIKNVQLYDLVEVPPATARAAIKQADGFLLGSPTLVGDALPPIYETMLELSPVADREKFAGAFGSYGWSGEAVNNITARLQQLRLQLPLPGVRVRFKPTEDELATAETFGQNFGLAVQGVKKA